MCGGPKRMCVIFIHLQFKCYFVLCLKSLGAEIIFREMARRISEICRGPGVPGDLKNGGARRFLLGHGNTLSYSNT